jgi:hypothetical protein
LQSPELSAVTVPPSFVHSPLLNGVGAILVGFGAMGSMPFLSTAKVELVKANVTSKAIRQTIDDDMTSSSPSSARFRTRRKKAGIVIVW